MLADTVKQGKALDDSMSSCSARMTVKTAEILEKMSMLLIIRRPCNTQR